MADWCEHMGALHNAQGCRINGCPCKAEYGDHFPQDPRVPAPAVRPSPAAAPDRRFLGMFVALALVVCVLVITAAVIPGGACT